MRFNAECVQLEFYKGGSAQKTASFQMVETV